jgi:hypothetical protein
MEDFRAEVHRAKLTNEWDRVAFWLIHRLRSSSEHPTAVEVLALWKEIQRFVNESGLERPRPQASQTELTKYLSALSAEQTDRVQSILASLLTQVR